MASPAAPNGLHAGDESAGRDVLEALLQASNKAEEGAHRTAELAAGAGRASYVPKTRYQVRKWILLARP